MAGDEDPFGFLINLCQPCPSDILKLRDCPPLRESEISPSLDLDSDTDLEQTPLSSTPTELTRIHMVSPPESESESESQSDEDTPSIDRIAPLENDVFHTPPEHHNRRSSSSSQEFLSQREKAAVNGGIDEQIQLTARVEDGVQLEGDEENLEVQGTTELEDSDGDLDENVMGVNGIVQTETSLKKSSVLVDELREFSKKIRASPSAFTNCSQPEGDETLGVPGMAELDRNDGDSEIHCSQNVMGGNRVVGTETNLKRYVLVDELREFSKKIRGSKEKPVGDTPSTFTNCLQPEGDETLHIPGMAESDRSDVDSEIHCSQIGTGVNRVVQTETSLNRYSLFVDELREFSKKIRASKENRNCDTLCPGQTDNQVDCTQKSALDKGPEERTEQKAVEEENTVEPCSMNNLDSASGKCSGGLKDIENEGISVTHVDLTAMDLEENGGISIEERLNKKAVEEPCSVDNRDSASRKSIGGNRDSKNEGTIVINLDSMEDNDGISVQNEGSENVGTTVDCEITRVEGSKVVNNEKVGEACLVMSTVDLSVKASLKVIALEENGKKLTDGESSSCSKNIMEIESFRYEGCVSNRNNPCKEIVCWGRRELPLSIKGKENEPRNPKAKKRSWQELIGAFEVYFKMDESLEDVDFLETAKRRGLTFP